MNENHKTPSRHSADAARYLAEARAMQAEAMADLAGRAVRAIAAAASRLWNGIKAARRRRAAYGELLRLDDRTLADIGLTRSDVEAVAAGLTDPATLNRSVAGRRTAAVLDFPPLSESPRPASDIAPGVRPVDPNQHAA